MIKKIESFGSGSNRRSPTKLRLRLKSPSLRVVTRRDVQYRDVAISPLSPGSSPPQPASSTTAFFSTKSKSQSGEGESELTLLDYKTFFCRPLTRCLDGITDADDHCHGAKTPTTAVLIPANDAEPAWSHLYKKASAALFADSTAVPAPLSVVHRASSGSVESTTAAAATPRALPVPPHPSRPAPRNPALVDTYWRLVRAQLLSAHNEDGAAAADHDAGFEFGPSHFADESRSSCYSTDRAAADAELVLETPVRRGGAATVTSHFFTPETPTLPHSESASTFGTPCPVRGTTGADGTAGTIEEELTLQLSLRGEHELTEADRRCNPSSPSDLGRDFSPQTKHPVKLSYRAVQRDRRAAAAAAAASWHHHHRRDRSSSLQHLPGQRQQQPASSSSPVARSQKNKARRKNRLDEPDDACAARDPYVSLRLARPSPLFGSGTGPRGAGATTTHAAKATNSGRAATSRAPAASQPNPPRESTGASAHVADDDDDATTTRTSSNHASSTTTATANGAINLRGAQLARVRSEGGETAAPEEAAPASPALSTRTRARTLSGKLAALDPFFMAGSSGCEEDLTATAGGGGAGGGAQMRPSGQGRQESEARGGNPDAKSHAAPAAAGREADDDTAAAVGGGDVMTPGQRHAGGSNGTDTMEVTTPTSAAFTASSLSSGGRSSTSGSLVGLEAAAATAYMRQRRDRKRSAMASASPATPGSAGRRSGGFFESPVASGSGSGSSNRGSGGGVRLDEETGEGGIIQRPGGGDGRRLGGVAGDNTKATPEGPVGGAWREQSTEPPVTGIRDVDQTVKEIEDFLNEMGGL